MRALKKIMAALALTAVLAGCSAHNILSSIQGGKAGTVQTVSRPAVESAELQFTHPAAGDTIAVFDTSAGVFKAVLFSTEAPQAVQNFTTLAQQGCYNGLTVTRVEKDFVVEAGQGADGRGTTIWNVNRFSAETTDKLHHYSGALCAAADASGDCASVFYVMETLPGSSSVTQELIDLMIAAAELIRAVFPNVRTGIVRLVKNSGSLYTLKIRSGWEDIAERFGDFSSISREAVSGGDEESGAFLRGVFVSCGSVTDPNKEYHLELVLPENDRTPALLDFIAEHGMSLKETARGGARSKKTVLYAKESELIEDCLTYIGAANHSMEIMQVKIVKDFRNRVNRSVNCENANLDKTVAASNKSTADIEYIFSTMGADWLSPDLRETARLRVENPEMSLSELCGIFPEKISRSGLNHRLKKLSKLAEELRSSRPE